MAELRIQIPDQLLYRIEQGRPDYLDRKAFVCLLLDQALTQGSTIPAYCVGAGKGLSPSTQGSYPQTQAASDEDGTADDGLLPGLVEDSFPLNECGRGVGKRSGETPRGGHKTSRAVAEELLPLAGLVDEFWRAKKGSRGDTAWKLLMTELLKIRQRYGEAVVREQLQLAINGKWAGITLLRYEQV